MLYKYLAVALGAAMLFDHIPEQKNPIKNRLSFVLFIALLFYFVDTSPLKNKLFERFDEMVNPVGIASAARQNEIAMLEASLGQLKDTVAQSMQAQTDPSVSASKEQQISALEKERDTLASKYQGESNSELQAEAQKVTLMQQQLKQITEMEQQINDLKVQAPAPPTMGAVATDPTKPTETADSCGCEAKIEKVLDDYIKAGKIADRSMQTYNDTMFSQLTPGQMEPLGADGDGLTSKWDHGFTYLNTSKWAPPSRQVPVCKTEQKCPVCPALTTGYPLNVLEFDNGRRVMPPDNINVDYIKQKLNKSV